jgi:hypothetical protein
VTRGRRFISRAPGSDRAAHRATARPSCPTAGRYSAHARKVPPQRQQHLHRALLSGGVRCADPQLFPRSPTEIAISVGILLRSKPIRSIDNELVGHSDGAEVRPAAFPPARSTAVQRYAAFLEPTALPYQPPPPTTSNTITMIRSVVVSAAKCATSRRRPYKLSLPRQMIVRHVVRKSCAAPAFASYRRSLTSIVVSAETWIYPHYKKCVHHTESRQIQTAVLDRLAQVQQIALPEDHHLQDRKKYIVLWK